MNVNANDIYTLAEVSRILRLSPGTIRNRVRTGRLDTLPRLGREPLRFLGSAILAYSGVTVVYETNEQRTARCEDEWTKLRLKKRRTVTGG